MTKYNELRPIEFLRVLIDYPEMFSYRKLFCDCELYFEGTYQQIVDEMNWNKGIIRANELAKFKAEHTDYEAYSKPTEYDIIMYLKHITQDYDKNIVKAILKDYEVFVDLDVSKNETFISSHPYWRVAYNNVVSILQECLQKPITDNEPIRENEQPISPANEKTSRNKFVPIRPDDKELNQWFKLSKTHMDLLVEKFTQCGSSKKFATICAYLHSCNKVDEKKRKLKCKEFYKGLCELFRVIPNENYESPSRLKKDILKLKSELFFLVQ